jgi:beta-glucanase (GH16 family)
MQIKIRRMTLSDFILNHFYRIRFWFFRNFWRSKLSNSSSRNKEGWDITFEDEFDEVSWNKSGTNKKWKIGEGWGSFHHSKPNVYYGPPELVPNSSCAKFTVKYNPKEFDRQGEHYKIPFEVSLLSTQKSFKQQYGRWECRCTFPKEPWTWPAFWTWGSTWPPEIDIWEPRGGKDGKRIGRNMINLHFGKTEDGTKGSSKGWPYWIEKEPTGKFHEFVCIWTPDKIEIYTDGIKIYRFTLKETLKWFNAETALQWIVINHSLSAGFTTEDAIPPAEWEDHILPKDYTSEFLVDYIRTYKNKE